MKNKTIITGKAKLAYLKALVVVYVEHVNKNEELTEDEVIEKGIFFAMTTIDQYNIYTELNQKPNKKICDYFHLANMCIEVDNSVKLLVIELTSDNKQTETS